MLARFLPRDQLFSSQFAAAAENVFATVRLLAEIVESSPDTER